MDEDFFVAFGVMMIVLIALIVWAAIMVVSS